MAFSIRIVWPNYFFNVFLITSILSPRHIHHTNDNTRYAVFCVRRSYLVKTTNKNSFFQLSISDGCPDPCRPIALRADPWPLMLALISPAIFSSLILIRRKYARMYVRERKRMKVFLSVSKPFLYDWECILFCCCSKDFVEFITIERITILLSWLLYWLIFEIKFELFSSRFISPLSPYSERSSGRSGSGSGLHYD
jgi:hypothetical protein